MTDIEKKIIEIKNASDTGIKENLYENKGVSHLNRDNAQDFEAAFVKLTDAGVQDVFDTTKSELIRKGNTLVIAQKSADGKLMPKLVIDGGNWDKTYELTVNFMKYLVNVHLRNIYQETTIEIAKNKDVTSVIASVKESLASASKEIPTKERIKELIHAINDQYQEEISLLNSFRKDHIIGGFKLKFDEQQRNNVALLRKMTEGHAKDLHFINERFYNITGIDAISGKTNPELEKDLRNPVYSDAFIKYNADLMYMSKQFNNIIALTNDPGFVRGKYPLSATNIVDYGLYGKDEIASFVKRFEKNKAIDTQKVEEMMKVAMTGLADQDYKALFNHLKGVAEGDIDPVQNPFKPKNVDKVKELVKDYPFLKEYGVLEAAKEQKKNDNKSGSTGGNIEKGSDQGINKPASAEQAKAAGAYKDRVDAFGRGGIAGLGEYGLDKTSMTPNQKRTWETVGNLALTGGIIFVGWKMISSAWKLLRGTDKADPAKQTKNRQRLLGPAGVILATNVLTGESPLALIKGGKGTQWAADKLAGWIGGKPSGKETTTELKYGEGLTGVTALSSGYEYAQIAEFMEEKDGIMKIREDAYENLIQFYENSTPKNTVAIEFLNGIGPKDKKNLVHLGLTAMGIKSLKDLQDTPKAKFSETAAGAITKLQTVTFRMKNYDSINPDKMDLIEAYIADKDAKIDKLDALEAQGDVFERDEDLTDKTGMADKIKELSQGDVKKEIALLRALNRFYKDMPAGSKKVEISGTWSALEFKTYDNNIPVNLETKGIEGLPDSTFGSDLELFKAANLTNYIKKTFKDKQAHSAEPFTVSSLGKDVEFDNTKTWSFDIDTEVISAGPGGTLEKISPTLENKKEAYAKYLNAHVEFKKPAVA